MTHIGRAFPIFLCGLVLAAALPTSLVEEVKSDDMNNRKVKRDQAAIGNGDTQETASYYGPTAIKRGGNLKTEQLPLLTEWDQQRFRQADNLPLYAPEGMDDKTLGEYEKGYRYGTNKDKLDEALENAILKSELYGDPAVLNQYRYYGNDDRRRRRRNAQNMRMSNRIKREVDLSPEQILAILTLWENERERSQPPSPHRFWHSFDPSNFDLDTAESQEDPEMDNKPAEEDWLDTPVYPHLNEHTAPMTPNYYYDVKPQVYEKRGRWASSFQPGSQQKRFMVARKRDPTREIRYLNGPTRNDFYTLSELLGPQQEQRDSNLPLYQRYML